ncbi:MAG: winged helix-turn-helix domain-containing protein [Thaumarchaeota archaeon]|nr:winged helix-turn-helix domain-containing protein [Candidatus Calditenuaceae archaeon]
MAEGIDERELLWMLRHRIRRKIIEAIGDSGKIGAVALRERLGISTGSLYYNLRQLRDLVAQDDKRNYVLTKLGEQVYRYLKTREDVSFEEMEVGRSRMLELVSQLFIPTWLISPSMERVRFGVLTAALSVAVLSALLINGKFVLIFLHVYKFRNFSMDYFAVWMAASALLTYSYFSLLSEVYERFSGRKSERFKGFRGFIASVLLFGGQWRQALTLIPLGLLPMSIYPTAAFVDRVLRLGQFESTFPLPNSVTANLVLVASQVISFLVFAAGLSYVRRIRWHVAALISFSLIYLSIIVSYLVTSSG